MPHLGIAVATTLGGWLNAGLLYATLAKRGIFVADARLQRALPRIVLASVIMGAVLWLVADRARRPGSSRRRRSWCAPARWRLLIGSGLPRLRRRRVLRPGRSTCASCARFLQPPHAAAWAALSRRQPALRCAPAPRHNPRRSQKGPPMAFKDARLLRHAADRQPAPRQLPRRHGATGSRCRRRTSASTASSTCTRSPCGRIPTELKDAIRAGDGRLHRLRPRPQEAASSSTRARCPSTPSSPGSSTASPASAGSTA